MHKMNYQYCVADSTPYEVGFQLGIQLPEDKELIKAITTPFFGQPLPQEQVEETATLFEKYILGINEEIKSFSDAANVSYMDMVIYSSYVSISRECSHFVILHEDSQRKEIFHDCNFLLSDKAGNAILIEVSPHKKIFKNMKLLPTHFYPPACKCNRMSL